MTYALDSGTDIALTLKPTAEDAVRQNIYCLLNTPLGEVPCYREYGVDKSYLHMPTTVGEQVALSAIAEAMARFFPELNIDQVDFTGDDDHPDQLGARIEVSDSE